MNWVLSIFQKWFHSNIHFSAILEEKQMKLIPLKDMSLSHQHVGFKLRLILVQDGWQMTTWSWGDYAITKKSPNTSWDFNPESFKVDNQVEFQENIKKLTVSTTFLIKNTLCPNKDIINVTDKFWFLPLS